MPSCDPDDLMAAANEIYSKIPAGRQLAVQTYLMAVRAGVTTNPDELAELAKQFNFGDQQSLQVQSYLLCQIANGSGGTCANLEGAEDDPTGIYTPTFIGQAYEGPNSVWKATGLTSADWTEICTDAPGVMTFQAVTLDRFSLVEDNASTEIHFPNLTDIIGTIDTGALDIYASSSITTIDAPLLQTVDANMTWSDNSVLSDVILTSLQTILVLGFNFSNCPSLAALPLPALITIGGNVIGTGCTSLTTFSAPNWLPTNGTAIDITNCALNQASVDLVLHRCVVAGVTTCTIALEGGTNSTPSAAGLADKAALILAGNTVTTN